MKIISRSVDETMALGRLLGDLMRPGDFIALTGELGSGKTHFARGVVAGIGVDPSIPVTSPTYTLMHMYEGRFSLYHFDLYRLSGDQEVADLGFEEYFDSDGACIVEWAERLRELLPEDRLTVGLSYGADDCRIIVLQPSGGRYEYLVQELAQSRKTRGV